MMKKTVSVILVFLVLISLSGCHGSESLPVFSLPDEFDTSRDYEITFWSKNDTNVVQAKIYQKAIDDFEKIYPNIHVSIKSYTDYRMIYNDVITNISTGTTPNVSISYPDHVATYMTGLNVVVPLDELMNDPEYGLGGSKVLFDSVKPEEIIAQYASDGLIGGKICTLPFMRSTEACYVNRDLVEKLGYELPDVLTWDFVWEVSEAAMEKNGDGTFAVNEQNVMIPFIYKSTDNMMIQMLRQKGADYSTAEGDILLFNDTAREFLYVVSEHAYTRAFSTFKISSYPGNFLNAGQCIFAVDSTAGATWMGTDAPLSDIAEEKLVRFDTVVYPVPQFDTERPVMISQGPSLCLFNKEDPQEVLASWLFMQYLLSNEVQIAYAQTEGYVPVTSKAQNDPSYLDYLSRSGEDNDTHYYVKIDATKLLLDNTENTFTTPVFNGSASLRDAAGQLIENVTKSARKKETIDDGYMDALYSEVISLYHLDQLDTAGGSRKDLGPLPAASKILLFTLAAVWTVIAAVFAAGRLKRKNDPK